jgi:hypothetical protein
MRRIPPLADVESIGRTLTELPRGIRRRLGNVPIVIGCDPAWIGLHEWRDAGFGRSYANTSHVAYEFHQSHLSAYLRETTVILNDGDETDKLVILHELGHVLDCRLGFAVGDVVPLDDYAAGNRYEAFATAFQSWATICGEDRPYYHTRETLMSVDPATCAMLDSLARS